MYAVVNMEGYETDDIFWQALEVVEETKDKGKIITQSTYLYQLNKGNHNYIFYLTVYGKKKPPPLFSRMNKHSYSDLQRDKCVCNRNPTTRHA